MRKTLIGATAFALGLVGALAFAAPASAAPGDNIWVANSGSKILTDHKVELTGGSTSVEAKNLGLTVTADTKVTFQYVLGEGVTCIGGAPRVFMVVNGTNVNSWDQNIGAVTQCGIGGAGKTVTFTLPAGTISAAGVVFDNSQDGKVTVQNLKVAGELVNFNAYEIKSLESIKAPTATAPTCDVTGAVKLPTEQEQEGVKYTAKRNVENGVTVSATVTAEAKFGYRIADGVKTEWTFPVTKLPADHDDCKETPTTPPADKPVKIDGEPAIGKVTCDKFEWSAPNRDQVNWVAEVMSVTDGVVTVKFTATAKDGFVIDGQSTWTKTFDIPDNCLVTPAPTISPVSGALPVTGSGSGVNLPVVGGLAGVALIALGAAALLWVRRRNQQDTAEFTA